MSKLCIRVWIQLFLVLILIGTVSILPVFAQAESQKQETSQINPMDIQKALTEAGFYEGAVDGIIGKKTRAAIRAFQEKNGLTVDGVCGPKTWEKLKAYLEEAAEMDAVDQSLTAPTVDETAPSTYEEEIIADPWSEPAAEEIDSGELKQKLVS